MAVAFTSVRDCVAQLVDAIARSGDDAEALGNAMSGPVRELMRRPDLLMLGIPRQANNVGFSEYLYYDGQLSILLYEVPTGKPVPPHDHGIWESLFVYRGRVRHWVYERADDGSVPGRSDLRIVSERVLEQGDFAVIAPPRDIHSFVALTEGTYGITVLDGAYRPDRHYYNLETGTYVVKGQKNAR
ncbi:MAG: hypothetical protein GC150_13465 [Rhizobiales bacterium]|nr:hypothetical protein [Hyphomicrobiales bacterium]